MASDPSFPEIVREAERLTGRSAASGVTLKLMGGVAVFVSCPSAREPPLRREYADLDFVTAPGQRTALTDFFGSAGYRPDQAFNTLHGHQRLLFREPADGRKVDVFVAGYKLCHRVDLRHRLRHSGPTLTPADLLLSKLQVVAITEKDLLDLAAIPIDHPLADGSDRGIDQGYLARLCANDWGLTQTVLTTLARLEQFIAGIDHPRQARAREAVQSLARVIEVQPKTLRWKARSVVGRRVKWYDLPEEHEE